MLSSAALPTKIAAMTKVTAFMLITLAGFVIIALPDSGKRLFSLSQDHGPSIQDAAGILLLLFGYGGILIMSLKRQEKIKQLKRHRFYNAATFLIGAGTGLLIASVFNDYKSWWIYGAALLAGVQVVFFYLILK